MKNAFGNSITYTIFGESHGKGIGMVLDGLAPGIKVDEDYIKEKLSLRRPSGLISTARVEPDEFEIISGVFNGYTTGSSLAIIIQNKEADSAPYDKFKNLPRPGHADYTANVKYRGFQDYRGSGHFSGRVTVALVAAGAIIMQALERKGIKVGTHILSLGYVWDRPFKKLDADLELIKNKNFATLKEGVEEGMIGEILRIKEEGDSIGGILETAITGVPAGIGEPYFDSVESMISHMMFSVPAIKGIEFGKGFGMAQMKGSKANDLFKCTRGTIKTSTNFNGGINGGITNGMPIIYKSVVKPTPSIYKEQRTINLITKEKEYITIHGHHDPAIIHRAGIIASSVGALAIADLLATHYGTDWLGD